MQRETEFNHKINVVSMDCPCAHVSRTEDGVKSKILILMTVLTFSVLGMSEFLFLSPMLIADPTSRHSLSPPYFYGLVSFYRCETIFNAVCSLR